MENVYIIINRRKVLIKEENDSFNLLNRKDLNSLDLKDSEMTLVESLEEVNYYLVYSFKDIDSGDFSYYPVRSLYNKIDEKIFWIIAKAAHLNYWFNTNKFCGKCGHKTEIDLESKFIYCKKCKRKNYPKISPAIIVAIVKDNKILLAKNVDFKKDFHSVLAGFVEPGESLEECLRREVREEVNIEVKNIQYFNSQPWPFPNSLMVGFTAEYASGEIEVEPEELVSAAWYKASELPKIPSKLSISRQLIDWFKNEYK